MTLESMLNSHPTPLLLIKKESGTESAVNVLSFVQSWFVGDRNKAKHAILETSTWIHVSSNEYLLCKRLATLMV